MTPGPSTGIWVFTECRDGRVVGPAVDLLAHAVRIDDRLSEGVTAVVIGDGDVAAEVGAVGVPALLRIATPGWDGVDGAIPAAALSSVAAKHQPRLILFSGTAFGRDIAPRVAVRLDTGIVADCTYIRVGPDQSLEATRFEVDGASASRLAWRGPGPALAVFPPGILAAAIPTDAGPAAITDVEAGGLPTPTTVVTSSARIDPADLQLEDATVLVAGGLGMGGPEGFETLVDLAEAMGGKVAASRRATDEGWAGTAALVGQTGKTVAPAVYLAMGISGASQHVLGMRDSGFIVSVNTDPHAPIHAIADLSVVGDAVKLTPRLAAAFRSARDAESDA